ncbi:MAG: APC family permease [Chloroflexi bacterium]|nr:APC family permease [Anaerolineaceae bacterium]NMB87515.1 APC family permease [Chloroflexota bacterium]
MNIEDNNGTTVLRRPGDYMPPKSWRNWLIGRPLSTADAPHQTIGKVIGLAVFASDALSSTAYATQEMLVILALAGTSAFHFSIPISFGIVILLAILTLSYEQTIHAYPNGGGAYIVARDNIGELPALVAGAALLMDYVLTVSVSVSSGVAQIISAYPGVFPYRVEIAVVCVFLIMLVNLRGVRESGITFSVPTYFFVTMMLITVITGFVRYFTGTLGAVVDPPEMEMLGAAQPITFFLILRAFSNGTSAVTGVEAISNGITAFKEPRSKNAGMTLIWMSVILGSFLLGITFLAYQIQAIPSEAETVISQLARTVFVGRGVFYLASIMATTVILIMAANTAFADFPRLSALVASDGFLPRQFAFRGSRLVYSRGIGALSLIACGLIIIFQASVTSLIPLYAIGVFLSFTLSQAGMAHRWWKSGRLKPGEEIRERGSTLKYNPGWSHKMIINGFGAFTTAIVMMVFAITKFKDGAWIVIILTPLLVGGFMLINRHYVHLAKRLSLEKFGTQPRIGRHRVILPISGVHQGTLAALRYARMLTDDITAVHVSIDPEETQRLQKKWESRGEGYRLVILESPYRLFIEPILRYIVDLDDQRQPNEIITVVVPQFVPKHWMSGFLHARTADTLRRVLLSREGIVITEVPYIVE